MEKIITEFIDAACPQIMENHRSGDLKAAKKILEQHPNIGQSNIFTASILGHGEYVEIFLQDKPQSATESGGPRNWEPLLYLCFSRFLRFDIARNADFLKTAKRLLDAGANPNTSFMAGTERETALYGAAGVANAAGLMKILLEAGADVNDPDAHYHAAEFDNLDIFKLFFDYGIDKNGQSTLLLRKLDFDSYNSIKYLLDCGADPNEQGIWGKSALHQAIMRGRQVAFIKLLLDYGAKPEVKMHDGKNAFDLALAFQRKDVLQLFQDGTK